MIVEFSEFQVLAVGESPCKALNSEEIVTLRIVYGDKKLDTGEAEPLCRLFKLLYASV